MTTNGPYMTSNFYTPATENAWREQDWDLLVLFTKAGEWPSNEVLADIARGGKLLDARVGDSLTMLPAPQVCGGRMILAPVADTDSEYQDVRLFADMGKQAAALAKAVGARRPLLMLDARLDADFRHALQVAALGFAQALWQPLEKREAEGLSASLDAVGVLADESSVAQLSAIEAGKSLARDLCGTEPERMSAPAFAHYSVAHLQHSGLTIRVEENRDALERDYPLLSAVARASFQVARHQPRGVRFEYEGEGECQHTFLLAGKGVVYDTGGADLKIGGAMAGMSRDKGGAAAVVGLMKSLSELKPKGIRVIADVGLVRNSIGSEAFVTDEIITSHAGVRVRIGNTDAEGRLVLADVLSHLRIKAKECVAPELFSVATLTGHVVRAYGSYTAAVENAVAREQGVAHSLNEYGESWGDPMEISRLRREDFAKIRDVSDAADILSSNNAPSSITARGHQFPAAFLLRASGLMGNTGKDELPLPYTHLDIAGSATEGDPVYGVPTAAPLTALLQYMLSKAC